MSYSFCAYYYMGVDNKSNKAIKQHKKPFLGAERAGSLYWADPKELDL